MAHFVCGGFFNEISLENAQFSGSQPVSVGKVTYLTLFTYLTTLGEGKVSDPLATSEVN